MAACAGVADRGQLAIRVGRFAHRSGPKFYGCRNVFERVRLGGRLTGNRRPSGVGPALVGLLLIAAIYVAAPNASLAASAVGPLLTGPPSISGSTVVGQTLTATAPTTGGPRVVVSYAWQRCGAAGANCAAITGATGSTHQLTSADAGATIVVQVMATDGTAANNSSGSSDAVGPVTSPPPPATPATIGQVTISGSAVVGQTLTAAATVAGDPPIAVAYQWSRCDTGGNGCAPIGGATASTYGVTADDGGHTLKVTATASNGTPPAATQTSAATSVVPMPVAVTQVTITGSPIPGQLLTASATATGVPAPTSITYHWRRCDASGNACSDIPGATAAGYTVGAADAGRTLVAVATATNGTTTGTGTSAPTGMVTTSPTVTNAAVSGVTTVGQTLQADATVGGSPAPTVTYQWQRCASGGSGCQDIARATGAQYALATADVGSTMRVRITASNGTAPDATGLSAPTAAIQAAATASPAVDTSGSGAPSPVGAVTSNGRLRVLTPFPVVRMRGRLLSRGANVTMFKVTGPVGVRVVISCTGRGCPRKRVSFVARQAATRVRAFQGFLRAGVHLTVRVSRRGYVGKITTFVIHANAAPARTDRCTAPTSGKIIRCTA
ncbi:MAG: hypothetical protein JWN32_4000 [Solirubrobacterales bacterium]|nr:hypothetical protein [Solirubrobacterales bacterium]